MNDTPPAWLAWIVPGIALVTALWAAARRLLITVTREELAQLLEKQEEAREARRIEMHQENQQKFVDLFDRMGGVEKGLSKLEGQLSGRYPRIDR